MINLNYIKFKNLLSIGNYPITYSFSNNELVAVLGSNGSSKSAINDALSFAFYGKPYRKVKKDELINNINKSDLEVEVEFSIGKIVYKIIRGIKPNKFELYKNGQEITQTSQKDLQNELESIIKVDYNLFCQTVLVGCNYSSFFELNAQAKRKILEDLFGLQIFADYQNFFKNKLREFQTEKTRKESAIEVISNQITKDYNSFKNAVELYKKLKDIYDTQFENFQNDLKELKEQEKELEEQYKTINSKYVVIRESYTKLKEIEYKITSKTNTIQSKKKELDNLVDHRCPTCDSILNLDKKEALQKSVTNHISKLTEEILALKEELQNSYSEVEVEEKTLSNKLSNIQNKLKLVRKEISDVEVKIKDTKDYEKHQEYILKLKESIESNKELVESNKLELKEINKEIDVLDKLVKTFSDDGVKREVLSSYIHEINSIYNEYLSKFNFSYSVEITEDYECLIRSYNGMEFTYYGLSQGEKSRINLTMILTLRKLFGRLGKYEFNLLVLDEVFDGALDSDGIESLLALLYDIETNVIFISHKEDIENIECSKRRFKKVNGFTVEI